MHTLQSGSRSREFHALGGGVEAVRRQPADNERTKQCSNMYLVRKVTPGKEGSHSREVDALPGGVEAVGCQTAHDRRREDHSLQHNLRRVHRTCGAHADAQAEGLQQ